jgi:hypothetical protein
MEIVLVALQATHFKDIFAYHQMIQPEIQTAKLSKTTLASHVLQDISLIAMGYAHWPIHYAKHGIHSTVTA